MKYSVRISRTVRNLIYVDVEAASPEEAEEIARDKEMADEFSDEWDEVLGGEDVTYDYDVYV